MATATQLRSLKLALSFDRPPICGGAISPSPEGLYLYYGKRDPRFIDFASVTSEELDLLLATCEPIPFRRESEGGSDESYRNASKLEAPDFAVQLDPVGSGLMRNVEDKLLQREMEDKCLRAEVCELNAYESGSFLKVHEGNPRSTDAFGWLVVIFPTPHEGGELVLRRKGHEWTFDANTLAASRSSPSLAYVAFYRDIEHEVLPVTAGGIVTVTYNLYLVEPSSKPRASVGAENVESDSNLHDTLEGLLGKSEFMPKGGILGFGLAHLYPVGSGTTMREMTCRLKGEDAHVYRVCQKLGLGPSLKIIYDDTEDLGIMVNEFEWVDYSPENESYRDGLVKNSAGVLVNKTENVNPYGPEDYDKSEWDFDEGEPMPQFITWISPFNQRNKLEDYPVTLGNEASAGVIYCSPCIIVRVAVASERV